MQTYKNLSGSSGIKAYACGEDFIKVQFDDGTIYRYTYASAGRHHVEQMKTLALAGAGLSTFISQHVQTAYESKKRLQR